ncbi:hypothetical protein A2U01_0078997 [Trifolium medium]|uniref:Uncharacterized protein n=1 Tax=Trifolium medium TaxID=97028 RepID=A0A392TC80_9FABA|nr:hypothetical protein [Trifolium medium]
MRKVQAMKDGVLSKESKPVFVVACARRRKAASGATRLASGAGDVASSAMQEKKV